MCQNLMCESHPETFACNSKSWMLHGGVRAPAPSRVMSATAGTGTPRKWLVEQIEERAPAATPDWEGTWLVWQP